MAHRYGSNEARSKWSDIINNALRGHDSIISRYKTEVAAVISIDEYRAFRRWQEEQKERQSED